MTDLEIGTTPVEFVPNSDGTIIQNTSGKDIYYADENDMTKAWFLLQPMGVIRIDEPTYFRVLDGDATIPTNK